MNSKEPCLFVSKNTTFLMSMNFLNQKTGNAKSCGNSWPMAWFLTQHLLIQASLRISHSRSATYFVSLIRLDKAMRLALLLRMVFSTLGVNLIRFR